MSADTLWGHTHAEWLSLIASVDATLRAQPRIAAIGKAGTPPQTIPTAAECATKTTDQLWEIYASLPNHDAKAEFYGSRIAPRIAQTQAVKSEPKTPAELWARHAEIRATQGTEAATRFFQEKIKPVTLRGWRRH